MSSSILLGDWVFFKSGIDIYFLRIGQVSGGDQNGTWAINRLACFLLNACSSSLPISLASSSLSSPHRV